MKKDRQNAIITIINQKNIETQEELTEELRRHGYVATQSTISRDIKELKIVKIAVDNEHYKYSVKSAEVVENKAKYKNILFETVVNVSFAQNLLVIHTYPGMANAAAAAIDTIFKNEILGSIAGDDTIIAVLHTTEEAEKTCNRILSYTSHT
jgi:transcriptional regulator of arginine metabolism